MATEDAKQVGNITINDIMLIMDHGYIIHSTTDFWAIQKISTPKNDSVWGKMTLVNSFEKAVNDCLKSIRENTRQKIMFSVVVRYDRGTGPEYKNMENIIAVGLRDAKDIAKEVGIREFGDNFKEAKVKPIGPCLN